jgi:hypothetical protein
MLGDKEMRSLLLYRIMASGLEDVEKKTASRTYIKVATNAFKGHLSLFARA